MRKELYIKGVCADELLHMWRHLTCHGDRPLVGWNTLLSSCATIFVMARMSSTKRASQQQIHLGIKRGRLDGTNIIMYITTCVYLLYLLKVANKFVHFITQHCEDGM